FKFDAGVCDIGLLRQHGNSDSSNLTHRSRNETEHDVDIVDHEIEHDVHVKTTRRERSKPMDLEKLRPSRGLPGCRNHRIESVNGVVLYSAATSSARGRSTSTTPASSTSGSSA